MSIEAIKTDHDKILKSSLYRLNGPEIDLSDVFTNLAHNVHEYLGHNEDLWNIGECEECALDDLLTGAYWAFSECHGGQNSPEYAAMCAIGRVYSPGCSNGPEEESSAHDAYQMIVEALCA